MQNPKATPLALLALLLFALPLLLTRQKFVELLAFGERSHQLAAAACSCTSLASCIMRDVRKNVYRFGAFMQQLSVSASSFFAVSTNCILLSLRLDL